jgi:hypothetical protein
MNDELNCNNQINSIEEKPSNVDLIYSYTESLLKAQEESLTRLDTRLGTFLAFAGVSLKFAVDLPKKSELTGISECIVNSSLVLKLVACGFSTASIVMCVLGLTARMAGNTVSPKTLMSDKWYWEEGQRCRAFIVNTWIEASKEYKKTGLKKAKTLNLAIKLICGAAVAFFLDTVLLGLHK